jgi:MOSC domain-containing protein YiiM
MAEILNIFLCLVHRFPMKEVEAAEAVENKGLRGCIHGRVGSKRQVLLVDVKMLEKFELAPGATKENLVVRGLDFLKLEVGQQLRVGEATFELSLRCEPCPRMEEIREGLEEALRGQRGWLCRVVTSGRIRKGDRIDLIQKVAAESAEALATA